MQREKLYNQQSKAHLNNALFVFKKEQNSVQLIFDDVKRSVFVLQKYLISSVHHLTHFI
jgi:hypothetical protein